MTRPVVGTGLRARGRGVIAPLAGIVIMLASCAPTQISNAAVPEPTLVLTDARLVDASTGSVTAGSLAIAGERIVAVGSVGEVLRLAGPANRVAELDGLTVVPGFVDHHVHLLNVGLSLRNAELGEALFLDLSGLDPEAIAARVAERARQQEPGTWILGKGWSQGAWGSVSLPAHQVLTAAAPEHPAFLTRVDGHASWLNAAALAAAGIDRDTADPEDGRILREPDGSPTGVLLEGANDPVVPLLPQPSDGDVIRAFRLATEALASQGVVEAFDAGFLAMPGAVGLSADLERYLELLRRADAEEPLPLRVHLMVPAPTSLASRVVDDPDRFRKLSPRLQVTHLKLFADGALGSRGAALSRSYADDPSTTGVPRMGERGIREWSEAGLDAGLDVAVHAIGDEAIRRTLDAFETLLAQQPELEPSRLRVEHFSFPRPGDVERAGELGIVLSIQPNFVIPDAAGRTMEDSRIGAPGAERVYAWGSARRAGALIAFGSDYFTAPGPSLLTLHAAVTRQNAEGEPPAGWHPQERLDRRTALTILTRTVEPGGRVREGSLQPGSPADLVVLSADPLGVPADRLLEIEVLATIQRGRFVFDREQPHSSRLARDP